MTTLRYGVQSYAWGRKGKESAVAQLKAMADPSFKIEDDSPYAEMWIGTHPKCPSVVEKDGGEIPAVLSEEAVGKETAKMFGVDVPYLLKVLSINQALSIQAHPTIEHAKKLHAKDPEHYPDPNHKPELLVALTKVDALVCFRTLDDIKGHVGKWETLKGLITPDILSQSEPEALRAIMTLLLKDPKAVEAVKAMKTELYSSNRMHGAEERWFLDLTKQFPDDTGALMVYVLNLVTLQPGEAIFLRPNEPHAYLRGDGVEIMAKSDNVVRAGLTPKFKDAETLLEMMTYDPSAVNECRLANDRIYRPPSSVPEFKLTKTAGKDGEEGCHTPSTVCIMLVVKGTISYSSDAGSGTATCGTATLFPAGAKIAFTHKADKADTPCGIDGDAVAFFAEANTA
eukprot:Sspe_Gene.18186::Locus_6511_Transcript_1_1_Confidence_1.000_Length_1509::g.18186::m.18186/K01809/manA, MPI; mannose-6-phosphate isomerase